MKSLCRRDNEILIKTFQRNGKRVKIEAEDILGCKTVYNPHSTNRAYPYLCGFVFANLKGSVGVLAKAKAQRRTEVIMKELLC